MGRRLRFGRARGPGSYGTDLDRRNGTLAGAAARSALVMFAALVVIAFSVALLATASPQTVNSGAFRPVGIVVIEIAQFAAAVRAGRVGWRRLPERYRDAPGTRPHLWAVSGPVAPVLAIDLIALAAGNAPWWRLLLDIGVTGLGAALFGVKAHRAHS